MPVYIFTLSSDTGPYRIRLHGHDSLASAIKFILEHEHAPERSIKNIKIERKTVKSRRY